MQNLVVVVSRKDRFLTHVVGWMSEPKCTQEIRDKWIQIWLRVDDAFGKLVKAKLEGAPAGHPSKAGATKA